MEDSNTLDSNILEEARILSGCSIPKAIPIFVFLRKEQSMKEIGPIIIFEKQKKEKKSISSFNESA